jgi:hypothetical protein
MTRKLHPDSLPRQIRRIVQTGDDRQQNHRADLQHCPSCDHKTETDKWDEAGVTLILEPRCYKAGCVTVMSECPKCFELSWIHQRMDGFQWNHAWPSNWKKAVKKREAQAILSNPHENPPSNPD